MPRANTREIEEYSKLLEDFHPKRPIIRNLILSFVVGGLICTVGQGVLAYFKKRGVPLTQAYAMTSAVMIFSGAFLTGLGFYDRITKIAGMGGALPITGFANSVVSPAMEYKREGFVLGVAARMFQVAGPVIVYSSLTATIVSILKIYVFK